VDWVCRRHPRDFGHPEIEAFLNSLSAAQLSASSERQAHNALLFLYEAALSVKEGTFPCSRSAAQRFECRARTSSGSSTVPSRFPGIKRRQSVDAVHVALLTVGRKPLRALALRPRVQAGART